MSRLVSSLLAFASLLCAAPAHADDEDVELAELATIRDDRCPDGYLASRYWGEVGSRRRTILTRLDVDVGEDAVGSRLNVAWAPRVAGALHGVFRIDTAAARAYDNIADLLVEPPLLAVGGLFRTDCDNYRVEIGARFVTPGWSAPTVPTAYDALDASLVVGPADEVLFMRRSEVALQPYVIGRLRPAFRNVMPSVEFGARFTTIRQSTWLGEQDGAVGGFWLDVAVIWPRHAGLRVGVRGEVGLSTLLPASEVLPLRADFSVGVSPWFPLTLSAGVGLTISPLSATSRGHVKPFGMLTVDVYYDDLFR